VRVRCWPISDGVAAAVSLLSQSWMSVQAGVTLKCLPHEKSARGEIITELLCFPLFKISPTP